MKWQALEPFAAALGFEYVSLINGADESISNYTCLRTSVYTHLYTRSFPSFLFLNIGTGNALFVKKTQQTFLCSFGHFLF